MTEDPEVATEGADADTKAQEVWIARVKNHCRSDRKIKPAANKVAKRGVQRHLGIARRTPNLHDNWSFGQNGVANRGERTRPRSSTVFRVHCKRATPEHDRVMRQNSSGLIRAADQVVRWAAKDARRETNSLVFGSGQEQRRRATRVKRVPDACLSKRESRVGRRNDESDREEEPSEQSKRK